MALTSAQHSMPSVVQKRAAAQPMRFDRKVGFGLHAGGRVGNGTVICRVAPPPTPSATADTTERQPQPPAADPQQLPLPPGASGLPFVGETLDFIKDNAQFYESRRSRYNAQIFRTHLLGNNTACVLDPKAARKVLTSEHTLVETQPISSLNYLFGEHNMQNQKKDDHALLRRCFMEAVNEKVIPLYYPIVEDVIDRAMLRWESDGTSGDVSDDIIVPIARHTRTITLQIGASVSLGQTFSDEAVAYMAPLWRDLTAGVTSNIDVNLPWTRKGRALRAKAELERYFLPYVSEMYAVMRDDDINGTADDERQQRRLRIASSAMWSVMNLKRPDGTFFMKREWAAEAMLGLLFAAHETTSWALDLCTYSLATFPNIAAKIHNEQMRVVAKHGEHFSTAAIADMPFTEAFLKEVFRYISTNPVPPRSGSVVFRIAKQDFELGGYRIPKGWSILVELTEPMKYITAADGTESEFNPERWFKFQSQSGRLNDASLPVEYTFPFSSGQRRCPGAPLAWAEMRVFVAKMVRRYNISLVDPSEPWRVNLDQGDIFNKPQSGLPCRLTRRS